jgi:hypothetical protein
VGIVVYSNGIVEELRSLEHTFSEQELINAFANYHTLDSYRLPEIPNTWMLWGITDNPPDIEFNKLGDEILETPVFSHIIFIHDSEINPSWNITDSIIYKSYEDFTGLVAQFLDEVSKELVRKNEEDMSQEEANSMIFLITMGHTKDKRVLFAFNPHEQNDMFFVDGSFDKFAFRLYDFMNEHFDSDPKKPFVIFADTKTVVIVEDRYVNDLLDKMLDLFKSKEKYEMCSRLSEIKTEWKKTHEPQKPKETAVEPPSTDASTGEKPKKTRKRKPTNPGKDARDE